MNELGLVRKNSSRFISRRTASAPGVTQRDAGVRRQVRPDERIEPKKSEIFSHHKIKRYKSIISYLSWDI